MRATQRGVSRALLIGTILVVAIATALVTALLVNIFERKSEARSPFVRLTEVTEDTTDPAKWAVNWPK
ncbi:MAG: ammonia-forming cytochrome c nitrite reductase subunit c552, partial [Vicinamibacterales bacterium]